MFLGRAKLAATGLRTASPPKRKAWVGCGRGPGEGRDGVEAAPVGVAHRAQVGGVGVVRDESVGGRIGGGEGEFRPGEMSQVGQGEESQGRL